MSNQTVLIKVSAFQPDERLKKSAKCGKVIRVPLDSLDQEDKSVEVFFD